ncbi:MAG: metallophosphoesterase [Candidatus Woesearchaeota archaeon]
MVENEINEGSTGLQEGPEGRYSGQDGKGQEGHDQNALSQDGQKLQKKLKVLASGDIHGDVRLARELADRAEKENVDLVILCGDITLAESSVEGLIGPFKSRNKKVLLVPGNHESVATADFLADFYGIKNLHGYSVKYEGVGIFGAGGANIGMHQIPENEMYGLLKDSHDKIRYLEKKIMVTHVHPAGTMMERFTRVFQGSEGVRRALEGLKPDILLCSHVHEAEGIEEKVGPTKVMNVGRKGKVFEI